MIRSDFEKFRGIGQAMDLIQNNPLITCLVKERLRILQGTPDAGQFAVEILCLGQRSSQAGLARAANPVQPNDRPAPPAQFDLFQPIMALNRKEV